MAARSMVAVGMPPIADRRARVLVLGSMPGQASLAARRYYAHPQNAFWSVMGAMCGAGPDLPYAARYARLRRAGIALWDVVARCVRPGSLDADIDPASIDANDFAAFFAVHRELAVVACNGATAFAIYRRRVLPMLEEPWRSLPVLALPSTSPAHAAMRPAAKARAWQQALGPWLTQ